MLSKMIISPSYIDKKERKDLSGQSFGVHSKNSKVLLSVYSSYTFAATKYIVLPYSETWVMTVAMVGVPDLP